jgi:hypothetical protein
MTTLVRNKALPAATSSTDIRPTLTKLRTATVDQFVFEKATGEVLGSYTTHDLASTPYDYEQPQIKNTRAVHSCYELDPDPRSNVAEIKVESLPDGVVDLDAERGKRGPKPKVKSNQHASLFRMANAEHHGWVGDYVFGACYTVAGDSKGTLNVTPSHVLLACLLDEISVEVVKRVIRLQGLRTMSDQQARRICQCARLAIGGMKLFLERHPLVLQQLRFEVDFADSYRQDNIGLLQGML